MTVYIEDYVPAVKYHGLNTAKDVRIEGNLTVTGTTTDSGNGLALANTDTTGPGLSFTGTGVYTGTGQVVFTNNALTTGVLQVNTANGLTTGQILSLASSATAIATTGRIFLSTHSGATGTSAVLNEFTSAANDETTVLKVTASDALAAGKVLFVSAAAMTTGTALDISGSVATTTGTLLNINDNSADTGTRSLVSIKQDHASASGATPLTILNDNATKPLIAGTATATSTNYFKFATINSVTIWIGAGTTANGNLSGTAGDLCLNGGSNKPEYCTGTTSWTALV